MQFYRGDNKHHHLQLNGAECQWLLSGVTVVLTNTMYGRGVCRESHPLVKSQQRNNNL